MAGGALDDVRLRGRRFDRLVPVPLHPARQRERGFNQADLLAELLSRKTSIPLQRVLQRIRYTKTQTAFDRAERMENLRNAFRLRKNADVRGFRVLLIDDVLTTGSTLSECARVLKAAGRTVGSCRDCSEGMIAMAIFKRPNLPERQKTRHSARTFSEMSRLRRSRDRNRAGENQRVCPRCDHHFAQSAKDRIAEFARPGQALSRWTPI